MEQEGGEGNEYLVSIMGQAFLCFFLYFSCNPQNYIVK